MRFFSGRVKRQNAEIAEAKKRAFADVDRVTHSIHNLNLLLEKASAIKIEAPPIKRPRRRGV